MSTLTDRVIDAALAALVVYTAFIIFITMVYTIMIAVACRRKDDSVVTKKFSAKAWIIISSTLAGVSVVFGGFHFWKEMKSFI